MARTKVNLKMLYPSNTGTTRCLSSIPLVLKSKFYRVTTHLQIKSCNITGRSQPGCALRFGWVILVQPSFLWGGPTEVAEPRKRRVEKGYDILAGKKTTELFYRFMLNPGFGTITKKVYELQGTSIGIPYRFVLLSR